MPTFDNIGQFLDYLGTRRLKIAQATEAGLRSAGELLAASAKDLIGHENEAWPPLAPSTIEEKERLGFVGQISPTDPLLRSGDLRQSITYATPLLNSRGGTLDIGSNDPVAEYQFEGTARIPARDAVALALHFDGKEASARVMNYELGVLVGRPGPMISIKTRPSEVSE